MGAGLTTWLMRCRAEMMTTWRKKYLVSRCAGACISALELEARRPDDNFCCKSFVRGCLAGDICKVPSICSAAQWCGSRVHE